MNVRERFDEYPDPAPSTSPIGLEWIAPMDDGLHYGWAWHRYRFCLRETAGIRILDAGCGTGVSTFGLARLNPGATVLGADVSPKSLEIARTRAETSRATGVEFHEHDLSTPLPTSWGAFDYVVCRGILGFGQDDVAILSRLSDALDSRGLLQATFPSAAGRMPLRQLRRAIEALSPENASPRDKATLGGEILLSLRADHPIRRFDTSVLGDTSRSPERFIAAYLNDETTDWTLEKAIGVVESAGLRFLYAAERVPWSPDRVFNAQVSRDLTERVGRAEENKLAALRDALDITLHLHEYRLFACPAAHEPRIPDWPEKRESEPERFARLIPRLTGLATRITGEDPAAARGAVSYFTVTGVRGEIDLRSHQALEAIDGRRKIMDIDAMVSESGGTIEDPAARAARWLDLSALGFILLESPDRRQHVDCRSLGSIVDRLDCACPRRWIRRCESHGHCSISELRADDPARGAFDRALARLGADRIASCETCDDYVPEVDVA